MLVDKKDCSACGACAVICPKNAISIIEDDCGYLHASIDESLCVTCKKCEQVCPSLQEKAPNEFSQVAFAVSCTEAYASESASGGVFSAVAHKFIENGGVVFATTLTENFDVKVISVTSAEDIQYVVGSKYVQSNMREAIPEIKRKLSAGTPVLFCGTPCQCVLH